MRFVHPRTLTHLIGLPILLIVVTALSIAHVTAQTGAEPGEEIWFTSGTLAPGQSTMPSPVFYAGNANFELVVDGGTVSDTLTLTVAQDGNSKSWEARSGERHWGTVKLNSTSNQWQIENTSGSSLSYRLTVYAQGETPVVAAGNTTWSGVGVADGNVSAIRLRFPTAGLYDFAFSVDSGRYQFLLDSAYFKQTVEKKRNVRVYVSEGVHLLRVNQDPDQASTGWSVSVTATEATTDTLAYSKNEPNFGGDSAFNEAWFPLTLPEATAANLRLTVSGAATDRAVVELYHGAKGGSPTVKDVAVYGGETVWLPVNLAKGVNRLRVVAGDGNEAPVSASLTVRAVPEVPLNWAGKSRGANGRNSKFRLDVPTSGLYQFDFGVAAGRFQFLLGDRYLQVTVDESGSAQAYLPEGRHTLTVVQDSAADLTNWEVAVTPLKEEKGRDTLPYTKVGGEIGGSENDFVQEWWPLVLEEPARVNVRLTVTGTVTNSLSIQVHDSEQSVARRPVSYGGETVWLTTDLSAGLNRLHLTAGSTGEPLRYQVDVFVLPASPASWNGVALNEGEDSFLRFVAPVEGVYEMEFSYSEGMIMPAVDPEQGEAEAQSNVHASNSGTMRMRVPLSCGVHTLQLTHNRDLPRTTWQGKITLRDSQASTTFDVVEVTPSLVQPRTPETLTITGSGFCSNVTVLLADQQGNKIEVTAEFVSAEELQVTLPDSLGPGFYDVIVQQSSEQVKRLDKALVVPGPVYLPAITAN